MSLAQASESTAGSAHLAAARRRRQMALYLLLAWVGVSLRVSVLGVPPVLDRIQHATGLGDGGEGVLTSLPVLLFGVLAIPGARLVRHIGGHRTVALGLLLVIAGGALRAIPADGALWLLLGTAVLASGIGIAQPALPRVLRVWSPERATRGLVIIAAGYIVGQVIAASLTVPLLVPLLGGWRPTMMAWSVPAAIALGLWLTRPSDPPESAAEHAGEVPLTSLLTSPLLWVVAVMMACTNLAFFTSNSWLGASAPGGSESATATLDLFLLNISALPVTLGLTLLHSRFVASRRFYLASALPLLVGSVGWMISPNLGPLWVILIGGGGALSFTAVVAYPASLTATSEIAGFSALLWTVGCAGAFLGPFLGGVGIQLLHHSRAPFLAIALAAVVMAVAAALLPWASRFHEARRA